MDNSKEKKELEVALNALAPIKGEGMIAEIRDIVLTNLELGRVDHFLKLSDRHTVNSYVERVAAFYESQHRYVTRVQEGADDVWRPLYEKMQRWAYGYLRRNNFLPGQDTFDLAITYAGEAGGNMVKARYPYDVAIFDAWAMEMVKNTCRKNMKKAMSQSHIPENQLTSLEDDIQFTDELYRGVEQQVAEGYDLEMILSQLNKREQTIILAHLHGEKPQETAAQMDITTNHVYKLRKEITLKIRQTLQGS